MSEPTTSWIPEASAHHWAGTLSQTIRSAIESVESMHGPEALRTLKRTLEEYEASPVARPREIVAYAVLDALGDCYAIRPDRIRAERARSDAIDYLNGAATCGHPNATTWVLKRLPFRMICIDAEERDALLEDGTPVLDREPS